jgi:hypothetical protein
MKKIMNHAADKLPPQIWLFWSEDRSEEVTNGIAYYKISQIIPVIKVPSSTNKTLFRYIQHS